MKGGRKGGRRRRDGKGSDGTRSDLESLFALEGSQVKGRFEDTRSVETKESLLKFSRRLFPQIDGMIFALDQNKVLIWPHKDLTDGRRMTGKNVKTRKG